MHLSPSLKRHLLNSRYDFEAGYVVCGKCGTSVVHNSSSIRAHLRERDHAGKGHRLEGVDPNEWFGMSVSEEEKIVKI